MTNDGVIVLDENVIYLHVVWVALPHVGPHGALWADVHNINSANGH